MLQFPLILRREENWQTFCLNLKLVEGQVAAAAAACHGRFAYL